MNNWHGSGGVSHLSSNVSASAAPRAFPSPSPNLMPHVDSGEDSGVLPLNGGRDSWDGPSITDLSANWCSMSSHKVDPAMTPYASHCVFSGAKTSGDMNGQLFNWDLPVGMALTDHVISHLGGLGNDAEVCLSGPSYSFLGGTIHDSPLTTNQPGFGGSSPGFGKSDKSFSDHHSRVFSSISDACDDRLDETAVKSLLKSAQIEGSYRLEEGKLASRHTAGTCNEKDVWSNEWGGTATKYPLESVRIDGNNWLVDGQLPPSCLTGTSNGRDPWNDGWSGPAVEYPLKSAQVVGEDSWHRAPHPELASDIWKQQTLVTPQSMWCNGSDPDYENLVMKFASLPATALRADASSIAIGQVTQSNGNSGIGANDEIIADLMPFQAVKSYPFLDTECELQFDVTYPRIQPDTNAFGNLYVANDEGLPKEKFSSKDSFDQMLQSSYSRRFSSLYMENSAGASTSHLACDLSASNPWSFHHSDRRTDSRFSDKGPVTINGLDGFYSQDIPIQTDSRAPSQKNKMENHDQEITVKDSGSFLKLPAISCTPDGEQRFDGTVEAGSSWSKKIQSPHGTGTGEPTATEPVLQLSSHNMGLNSFFPLPQKLNEHEKTIYKMHPCGNPVATTDVRTGTSAVANASSVTVKEISDSSVSVHAPQNLSEKEKSESIPEVNLHAMVLTLHNLSEFIYYYTSTGKCEVGEEERHLLEKAIHSLASCSSKDLALRANSEEVLKNSKEEPTPCCDITTQLHVLCQGQLEDRFNGDNEMVKGMPNGEENSSGMLSSGVVPHVKDNTYTQILDDGKRQSTDEGKFSSEMLSSGVNSHSVKGDNAIQAIKEILSQHYHDGPESDPQVHFFRNLWLEAEAELCSQNCKVHFNHVKSKLDAYGMKDSSETASAVEKQARPATSVDFIAEDNFYGARGLEQNKKMIDSPGSCNNAKVGGGSDVMVKFDIPKGWSHDLAGAPPLITAKDAEVDILTEKASTSPCVSCSSILIGTTCCGENIDDAVMTRFNILIQRDESLSSKQENSARVEADEGIFEKKMCSTARDFPENNKSEAMTSTFSEHMENLPPHISEISVMSRWNIVKQPDENVSSIENIVDQETDKDEQKEEPIDGHGARELGHRYPDIMGYYNTLGSSSCGELGTDSVRDRLKILKLRDGNRSSTENNFVLQESVDIGAAIRGDYLSAFKERWMEGSMAKAKYVLQEETASPADDAAKLDNRLGGGDDSAIGSHLKCKTSGGWFDIASSDWEHVWKEEVAGGTTL